MTEGRKIRLILLTGLIALSACTSFQKKDARPSETLAEQPITNDSIKTSSEVRSFLTDMYTTRKFEDAEFLKVHCSSKLLHDLSAAYADEYDPCDDCYAVWLFRSGAQDTKPGSDDKMIVNSIESLKDNWYRCDLSDGGWKCIKKLKVVKTNGVFTIEDIITEYSEL